MASKKSEGALTSSGGLPFEQRIDVEGATP
jgi:hypothetical protein